MSTSELSTWLKYANLQMAAEAFLIDKLTGKPYSDTDKLAAALLDGNKHSSKFTPTQAAEFATEYTVVAHQDNTGTGFSGTLFKDNAGNYTLSFRSTEFVDDVIADSVGTNEGISQYGWAFGQISDMETWWATLKQSNPELLTKGVTVTGYSLGGHLATAFAQLRAEEGNLGVIDHIYTYNGAGTGGINTGHTLTATLALFNDVWKNHTEPAWAADMHTQLNAEAISNQQKILDEAATVTGYVSGLPDGSQPLAPRTGAFADFCANKWGQRQFSENFLNY